MFPSTSSRETLGLSGKQNLLFPSGPYIKCIISFSVLSCQSNSGKLTRCKITADILMTFARDFCYRWKRQKMWFKLKSVFVSVVENLPIILVTQSPHDCRYKNEIFARIRSTAKTKLEYIADIVLDRTDSLCSWVKKQYSHTIVIDVIAPAGFWPRGQNPRRHPRIPRVYTYKEFENVRK